MRVKLTGSAAEAANISAEVFTITFRTYTILVYIGFSIMICVAIWVLFPWVLEINSGFIFVCAAAASVISFVLLVFAYHVSYQSREESPLDEATTKSGGLLTITISMVASAFAGSTLLAALSGGYFYIDVLRYHGPLVTISLDGNAQHRARIALPATEGLIVFYEGETAAQYLPFSRVKAVMGRGTGNIR